MLLWIAAALAAPEPTDEEVIVYGDQFARWDETRWFVQTELWVPLGMTFAADQNLSFLSNLFQVRAIVFCEKDANLGKHKLEVNCTIEDIGLRVTTQRNWRRERDREIVREVLEEIDAKVTGAVVQLQVDDGGGVTNFDLEGLVADNAREREIQETLRQIVSRTMSGFHLRIPDQAQRSGQWVEYRSQLMQMPSLTSSRGSTTLVHQVSPYRGMQLVQTVGQGTQSVALPARATSGFTEFAQSDDGASVDRESAEAGSTASIDEPAGSVRSRQGAELSIEMTYELTAAGVAVFRKDDGVMTERVWNVEGKPTASSAGGVDTGPFRNAGRLQLLAEGETADVGVTDQVAWPGRTMDGLAPWVALETLPAPQGEP